MQEQHIEFLPQKRKGRKGRKGRKEKRINILKARTYCISVINFNVYVGNLTCC
jgi:hypothetical protein